MLNRAILKLRYAIAARRRLRNKSESLKLIASQGWKPDVVVDIGAGYGTRGLMDPWPEAHAILVEPQPELKTVMEASATTFVSASFVPKAAGASDGVLKTESGHEIEITTVDHLVHTHAAVKKLERALVKIDVDGPECDVLRGSRKTLADYDCVVLVEGVLNDRTHSRFTDIVILMRELGYEVTDLLEAIYRPHDDYLWQVDLMFTKAGGHLRRHLMYYSDRG